MSLLEVNDIEIGFNGTEVLKGVSFSMERGEVISIIGSSGSGKTTLLRCLNSLETPDSGSISLDGETLFFKKGNQAIRKTQADERKRLSFGLVFQSFNLFPQYTALENITLAMRFADKTMKKEARQKRAAELLFQMGLGDKAKNYPHQLSGGQQQRVAIARALALQPKILCFDEPTSALDPEISAEILNVIKQLAKKNTTMIIVTHEMGFAREVSDKIIYMENGVVAESGTPSEIFTMPKNTRLKSFIGAVL